MQFGLTMEFLLRLFAVILVVILLKQLLFRLLMAIAICWAHRMDHS